MVEAIKHGPCDELAVGGLGCGQLRVRVGNPVDALVDAGAVVPAVDVLVDDGAKLPFVPDQDAVEPFGGAQDRLRQAKPGQGE